MNWLAGQRKVLRIYRVYPLGVISIALGGRNRLTIAISMHGQETYEHNIDHEQEP